MGVRSETRKLVRELEKLGATVRKGKGGETVVQHRAIGGITLSASRKDPPRHLHIALKKMRRWKGDR